MFLTAIKLPDTGVSADTFPEETDSETQPVDQASAPTELQSPDKQAEVAQSEGSQDGQCESGTEQPSSTKNTVKKKQQDTDADNNKEVSGPAISYQEGTPDSFTYIYEMMKSIGTKLVDASTEKPAIGDLRKIIQDTMKELTNLLALVPEDTCAHSGATLSGGPKWESSCPSVAPPVLA